jgi:hypothetical protein
MVTAESLLATMRAAGVVLLYTTDARTSDPNAKLSKVQLYVYTSGLTAGGVMTSYVYTAAPQNWTNSFQVERDTTSLTRRLAVTSPPIHWYWERLVR